MLGDKVPEEGILVVGVSSSVMIGAWWRKNVIEKVHAAAYSGRFAIKALIPMPLLCYAELDQSMKGPAKGSERHFNGAVVCAVCRIQKCSRLFRPFISLHPLSVAFGSWGK